MIPAGIEEIREAKSQLLEHVIARRVRAKQLMQAHKSRTSLIDFAQFMMPDADDPLGSDYEVLPHHLLLAEALEQLEQRKTKRMNVNLPPRAGKSQLSTRFFPAWYLGKHPDHFVVIGSYNDDIAGDFGEDVRTIMQSERYRLVFPEHEFKGKRAVSKKKISLKKGGVLFAIGRGGAITGRGAHVAIIDDPIKDRVEADSKLIRDKLWKWFTQVIMTRLMGVLGVVMIVQTRWHEDDIPGRLLDPRNIYYNKKEAGRWVSITIPALAEADDPLGRAEGEPLWPERFPKSMMQNMRDMDPRGFASLYQGHPTVEDGDFFKAEYLRTYDKKDLPPLDEMKIYGSGDYATKATEVNDRSCLGIWGVDKNSNIYLLDLWWGRAKSDVVMEKQIALMKKWKPSMWMMESSTITQSLGPFMKKRMREEHVFCVMQKIATNQDPEARAQSIRGRMSMGMVWLPREHPKWLMMRDELLAFPAGMHDDFVAMCAYFGMKLHQHGRGHGAEAPKKTAEENTLRWLKEQTKARAESLSLAESAQGW